MTDFQVTTQRTGRRIDTRWRAQSHGENVAVPGQLDPTKFVEGTHYNLNGVDDNVVPSGVGLTKLSSGLYGPFDGEAEGTVLDGYINDNQGVDLGPNPAKSKPTCAVLKHGVIDNTVLPIAGQRDAVVEAKTTGAFVYVAN